MSLLRIKELEAQLARRDERIAELERACITERVEGWMAARQQSAEICAIQASIRGGRDERFIASKCAEHIHAMHPPTEWNVSS